MEKFVKNFFTYGFFFIFPLTAFLIPEIKTGFGYINVDMMWLLIAALLFLGWVIKFPLRCRLSPVTLALGAYYGYFLANAYFQGQIKFITNTSIFLMVSGFLTLVLIEQLDFTADDRRQFIGILSVLIIPTFIGTLLQIFVDNSLFYSQSTYDDLLKSDFEGFWRNSSIFDAMLQNSGAIGFIFMAAIFIFLNRDTFHQQYIFPLLLLFIVIYFTYSRYIIFSTVIFIGFFIFKKIKKHPFSNYGLIVIGSLIIAVLTFYVYKERFFQSEFYNVRLLADVSGRTTDPFIFLNDYLLKHPIIFGTGFSSYDIEYYYTEFQRLHSGIWDLLFQGGVIGLLFFLYFLYRLHQRNIFIYKKTKNPVFLLFAPIIFFFNLTGRLNLFFYWGYILMFYYMALEYRIATKQLAFDPRIKVPEKIRPGLAAAHFLPGRR